MIDKIIRENDEYTAAAIWANENGARIIEIEPDEAGRRFKVVPVPAPTEKERNALRVAELQNYLAATDWYAVRFAETGVEIPDEVKTERQAAREEISRLRESGGDNG